MAKLTYRDIPDALEILRNFDGNSLKGENFWVLSGLPGHLGQLPATHAAELRIAAQVRRDAYMNGGDRRPPEGLRYVLYSYGTPIAWVLVNGDVIVPDVKYSGTTSRAQNLAREHLARRAHGQV